MKSFLIPSNKDTIFFTSGSMEQLGAQWDSLFTFFSNSNINYIFHIDPMTAKNTPISLIKTMMTVHGEVKKIEAEEIQKHMKR